MLFRSVSSNIIVESNVIIKGNVYKTSGETYINTQWSNLYSSNIYYNLGFVGIGTTNPQANLDVIGTTYCSAINVSNYLITSNLLASIGTDINKIISGVLPIQFGGLGVSNLNSNQILIGNSLNPIIQSSNFSFVNNRLIINSSNTALEIYGKGIIYISDKLGIGTTNPINALDIINGNIYVSSKIGIGKIGRAHV